MWTGMIVMVTQKPECGKAAYPREERTSEMGLILEEERQRLQSRRMEGQFMGILLHSHHSDETESPGDIVHFNDMQLLL